MAYNRRYNPDALPAHAEPDQAKPNSGHSARDSSRNDSSYANKPPPPAPISTLRGDRDERYAHNYSSPTRTNSAGYDDRRNPISPRHGGEPPRSGSYSGSSSRYEQGSYGSGGSGGRGAQGGGRQSAATPAPRDGNDRDALWPMFKAVDKDRSGHLSEQELGNALVNGDYTSFDPHTVKMMIRMFDVDRSQTIDFDEFCNLWGFLSEWRKLFDRFDVDRSGTISFDEFQNALLAFGYRLSPDYVGLLFSTYDTRGRHVLSFDLFVQACISLKRMTDVFKRYDQDRDGYITLSFEQFLTEILRQR